MRRFIVGALSIFIISIASCMSASPLQTVSAVEAPLVQDDARLDAIEQRLAAVEAEVKRVDGEVFKGNLDQIAGNNDRASLWVELEHVRASRSAQQDVWYRLRMCESGNNYAANTGNGYYGAYQASHSTWGGYAGYSDAHLAPPAVQDEWARKLQALRGWQPWPACSRKLGLR